MSWDWLTLQCAKEGVALPPRLTLYTVAGTSADMWTGYPADTARALNDEVWYWQPVNYPAATFPMNTSVDAGVTELVRLIKLRPGKFALDGYSQGALVTSKVWRDHILNPAGELHDRLGDVVAAVTHGNPMRAQGVANGNVYAGWPIPSGAGIAGSDDLTPAQTPSWWYDFAHGAAGSILALPTTPLSTMTGSGGLGGLLGLLGSFTSLLSIDPTADIYTDTPVGTQAGADMTAVFNLVQSKIFGPGTLLTEALGILTNPTVGTLAAVQAIMSGLLFVGQGTGPHVNYDITPAIAYLAQVGAAFAAS